MRKIIILTLLIASCNTQAVSFEKEFNWQGHWEQIDKKNEYFSSGFTDGEIKFYFSNLDTINKILDPFKLLDFNYKKKSKLFQTYDGQYIQIIEIQEDEIIEVIGPANSKEALGTSGIQYIFKESFVHPQIPNSLIYGG